MRAKTAKQKWLWITDPWETLDHPRDTTLRLIEEGVEQGISQYWADASSIRLENEKVLLDAREVLSVDSHRRSDGFSFAAVKTLGPADFSAIHYRVDPPVNAGYLDPLRLLGLALQDPRAKHCEIVNPLPILFLMSEKMEACALLGLSPLSVVSSQKEVLVRFLEKEKQAVLKPLNQAQSKGVELLNWKDPETRKAALRHLLFATQGHTQPVLLQKFLKGIQNGETRLWFVDGQLLARVRKMPVEGDFRVNLDQGSAVLPIKQAPSAAEKTVIRKISAHLKKHRIRLAAIDLIDLQITDFNITSPGLIPLMELALGQNLARKVVRCLQRSRS